MTQQNNYINFNKKTVFVVGAGASLPYGYPLGAELVDKVIEAAEKKKNDKNAEKLIELIKFHDPLSIDSFLAQHCRDDEELTNIGKQLIAECILECEDRDAILEKGKQFVYNAKTKQCERGNENWYRYLAHAMFEDKKRLINDEPLPFKIITFNYDVSLDYYLLERVWRAFENDKQTAKKILLKLKKAIIHVYGAVRDVPWDNPEVIDKFEVHLNEKNKKYYIRGFHEQYKNFVCSYEIEKTYIDYIYGSHSSTNQIISQGNYHLCQGEKQPALGEIDCGQQLISKAAKCIKVIDERNEQIEGNLKPFKQYMAEEAQRIMFLGFGFDKQNMKLLFDENIKEILRYGKGCSNQTKENYFRTKNGENCQVPDSFELANKFSNIPNSPRELCYTNYGDSEKLNRRIENYFPKDRVTHSKSIKGVYEALTQDFDLD